MWMYAKRLLVSAGLAVGLYACAVGGGDGDSEDDPMGDAAVVTDSGAGPLDSGTPALDSGPGGTFSPADASFPVDSSIPRDSSVTPTDGGGGAADAAPLAGLGGIFGGLFGGGADAGP